MSSASSSPLLDKLPAELRNNIYRLVLQSEDEINVDAVDVGARMPLLHTCTQVRREANGIFYSENTFKAVFNPGQTVLLAPWLDVIGNDNTNLLKSVEIMVMCSEELRRELQHLAAFRHGLTDLRKGLHTKFELPMVEFVMHLKSSSLEPTLIRIYNGTSEYPTGRGLEHRVCDLLRDLLQLDSDTEDELMAGLSWARLPSLE